jgi:hypothetical protein
VPQTPASDRALREAYARYEAAQEGRDRKEVVTARLNLCLELIATGWQAPEPVREQMQRDEKTLRRLKDSSDDVLGLPAQRWLDLRTASRA